MARVDVSTSTDVEPSSVWKLASDLPRFDEWMTIFGGWCGSVPSTIEEGTRVSSLVRVKGFRNVIHWTVTRYDEPTVSANHPGSTLDLTAELNGGVLSGPIGKLVARVLRSDVRASVCNLAALQQSQA